MVISSENKGTGFYKGWLVTIAGTGALLAMGVLYAWSVFKANIPDEWGWADSQKSLPYSITIIVFSLMTLTGAHFLGKYGPRVVISAGGVMAGLGMIISSQSSNPIVFAITFGGLLGSGIGFVYSSASPAALKWFPAAKTGLITGIVVAGFGMGSAWVAPLARTLIASIGLQSTMLYLGIGMLVVVVALAQWVRFPPAGFIPAGSNSSMKNSNVRKLEFTPGEIVKTWQFYLLWIAFALGSGAGLMVIGNLASIVSEQIGIAAVSGVAVSALALGNGTGRVLFGMMSDKFGRKNVLLISFISQAALIYGLSFIVSGSPLANVPLLMILVSLIGANFGAKLAVFPAMTKDYYGDKNFAMNYGIVYTAWGLGGFMLSQLAGFIKDFTGNYNNAYLLATGLLLVAAVLMRFLKTPQPAVLPEIAVMADLPAAGLD